LPWDLDPKLEFSLGRLLRELQKALQEDLISVALVGFDRSLAFEPESSEIRLLFVLAQVGARQLGGMVEPLVGSRRELRIDPMVYSRSDLQRSLDVFPLQIVDIKRGYEILHGPDVLAGVKLHRCDTRLAVEREIKTVLSRLHHLFLIRSGLRPAWQETIQDTVTQVIRLIGFCLLLAGQRPPAKVSDQLLAAQQYLGLQADVLSRAYELSIGKQRPEARELAQLFESYLENVGRLAHWVDQLKVNS
jgi:hypothetical protein